MADYQELQRIEEAVRGVPLQGFAVKRSWWQRVKDWFGW